MKKSLLRALEQDFIDYSKMADEARREGNESSYNYWNGKAQGYYEVIELLKLNVKMETQPKFTFDPQLN